MGLGLGLTGKLGRAWVCAWVGAWHGAWVVLDTCFDQLSGAASTRKLVEIHEIRLIFRL